MGPFSRVTWVRHSLQYRIRVVPKTVVDTLSVVAGRIVAGTTFKPENTNSIDMATAAGSRGNVLYRAESGEWQQAGEVPAGIHSIASV